MIFYSYGFPMGSSGRQYCGFSSFVVVVVVVVVILISFFLSL